MNGDVAQMVECALPRGTGVDILLLHLLDLRVDAVINVEIATTECPPTPAHTNTNCEGVAARFFQ